VGLWWLRRRNEGFFTPFCLFVGPQLLTILIYQTVSLRGWVDGPIRHRCRPYASAMAANDTTPRTDPTSSKYGLQEPQRHQHDRHRQFEEPAVRFAYDGSRKRTRPGPLGRSGGMGAWGAAAGAAMGRGLSSPSSRSGPQHGYEITAELLSSLAPTRKIRYLRAPFLNPLELARWS
jgi:hypothetical protein